MACSLEGNNGMANGELEDIILQNDIKEDTVLLANYFKRSPRVSAWRAYRMRDHGPNPEIRKANGAARSFLNRRLRGVIGSSSFTVAGGERA